MIETPNSFPYSDWLREVKERIRAARLKVALAANSELIAFYWDLGKMMNSVASSSQWGNNWMQKLSKDLREEFPDMEGFSKRICIISSVCSNSTKMTNFSTRLVEKFLGDIM